MLVGVFFPNLHNRFPALLFLRWEPVERQFPTYSTAALHPPLPSTPQRRRLNNCTSSFGKRTHLHTFFLVCAVPSAQLARSKRHMRASCHEERANSKRNLLVEEQNLEQQPSFKLLLPISAGKYPRSNRCQAFRDVTQLILLTCFCGSELGQTRTRDQTAATTGDFAVDTNEHGGQTGDKQQPVHIEKG